jgi:hypothetical protein
LTVEDLELLLLDTETAYYSGTLRVKTGDKEVWYDNRLALKARISELKNEINLKKNPTTKKKSVVLTYHDKGL